MGISFLLFFVISNEQSSQISFFYSSIQDARRCVFYSGYLSINGFRSFRYQFSSLSLELRYFVFRLHISVLLSHIVTEKKRFHHKFFSLRCPPFISTLYLSLISRNKLQ